MTTSRPRGFTLIELLITIAILAILVVIALSMVGKSRDKASDAKVKDELHRLKIAFEDYYGDHNCYPPADWFNDSSDCGSSNLSPYMSSIPCDPTTKKPYVLETDNTGCSWFKLYGNLKASSSDPEVQALCNPDTGSNLGDYGVSSDNVTVSINCTNTSSGSDSGDGGGSGGTEQLPGGHNYFWCSSGPSQPGQAGNCTFFDDTVETCTPYFTDDSNCGSASESNRCQTAGSCTHL